MIIYNKTWLNNLLIQEALRKDYQSGNITPDELKTIEEKYPVGFYTPNLFIRAGLFILTAIIVSFGAGLISLILMDSHLIESWGYVLFLGLATYAGLEALIFSKHHFRSGADDALIWISAGFILASMMWFLSKLTPFSGMEEIAIAGFMVLIGIYYTLRFADLLMAGAGFLSLIAFIYLSWIHFNSFGMLSMPFLMILVSLSAYLISRKVISRSFALHYFNCLKMIQVLSLLALYLSGNYFVVDTLGGSVPFAPFFWIWTFSVPMLYIALGLRRKEQLLIRTGLLLIAAAAFTFRNYYHVMPVEGTLTILGIVLLMVAYGTMKYLKTPKYGFTYEMLDENDLMDKLKVESLIVSETFSGNQIAPPAEGTTFGGGNFGGGGSSGNF